MNKQKLFKVVGAVVLLVTLMITMVGCSDAKAEKEYYDHISTISKNVESSVTKMNTAIADLKVEDKTSKTNVLTAIDNVEKDFKELQSAKAPKKYEEAQTCFKSASDKALKALEIYKGEFTKISEKSDMIAVQAKLTEGDTLMTDAANQLKEGSDKAEKVSGVTSKAE